MDLRSTPEFNKFKTYQNKVVMELTALLIGKSSLAYRLHMTQDPEAVLDYRSREQDTFSATDGRWELALVEFSKINTEVSDWRKSSNEYDIEGTIFANPTGFSGEDADFILLQLNNFSDYYKGQYAIIEEILKNVGKYDTVAKWDELKKTKEELLAGVPVTDTTVAKVGLMAKARAYLKNPTYIIIGAFLFVLIYFMFFHPTKKMK